MYFWRSAFNLFNLCICPSIGCWVSLTSLLTFQFVCLLQVFGCLNVFIIYQYCARSVRVYVCLINSKGFLYSLKQSVLLGLRTLKIKLLKRKPSEVLTFLKVYFNTHRCLNSYFHLLYPSLCFVNFFHLASVCLVLHSVSCQSLQVHGFSVRKY